MRDELARLLDEYRARRMAQRDFLARLVAVTGSYVLAHQPAMR